MIIMSGIGMRAGRHHARIVPVVEGTLEVVEVIQAGDIVAAEDIQVEGIAAAEDIQVGDIVAVVVMIPADIMTEAKAVAEEEGTTTITIEEATIRIIIVAAVETRPRTSHTPASKRTTTIRRPPIAPTPTCPNVVRPAIQSIRTTDRHRDLIVDHSHRRHAITIATIGRHRIGCNDRCLLLIASIIALKSHGPIIMRSPFTRSPTIVIGHRHVLPRTLIAIATVTAIDMMLDRCINRLHLIWTVDESENAKNRTFRTPLTKTLTYMEVVAKVADMVAPHLRPIIGA